MPQRRLAEVNGEAIAEAADRLRPGVPPGAIRFATHDLSLGLPQFGDASVDGIVAGLAISYAESLDPETGTYTDVAYDRVLADAFRVLEPGGRLVFSVNVPKPKFRKIFARSLVSTLRAPHLRRVLYNAIRMLRYGRWLRREADRGRFHFFAIDEIERRLRRAGFTEVAWCLSYADRAYVVSAEKLGRPAAKAA